MWVYVRLIPKKAVSEMSHKQVKKLANDIVLEKGLYVVVYI